MEDQAQSTTYSAGSQEGGVSEEARARLGRLPRNRVPPRRVLTHKYEFPHPSREWAEEITKLATYGLTISEVSQYLQLSIKVIQEFYQDAFDRGALDSHVSVARRVLYDALHTRGMVGLEAAKFWLKNRATSAFGVGDNVNVRGVIGVVNAAPGQSIGDLLLQQGEKLGRLLEFTRAAGTAEFTLADSMDPPTGSPDPSVSIPRRPLILRGSSGGR